MAQRSAGKHDQLQGYMTVLLVNYGLIKSSSILTAVIHPMIHFDIAKPSDYFNQQVQWKPAIS